MGRNLEKMGNKFSKKTGAPTFRFASVKREAEYSDMKLFLTFEYIHHTTLGYALEYHNLDRNS